MTSIEIASGFGRPVIGLLRTWCLGGLLAVGLAGNLRAAGPPAGESSGIRYQKFDLSSPGGMVHLVVFDPARYTLRVIDNGSRADRPQFSSVEEAVSQSGGLAGINGGFFDPQQFTPSGLMAAGGRTVSPFNPKGWQEGVLTVRKHRVTLIERDAFAQRDEITDGLQSSPWLIRSGRIDPALQEDVRRARRVFVATSEAGRCAIGLASPVTFQELAEFLQSGPVSENIEISQALALDGASSAGFWCHLDGQLVSDRELVTVRNFVVVVPVPADAQEPRVFRVAIVLVLVLGFSGAWAAFRRSRA